MSKLRPNLVNASPGTYAPKGGTAYLMILAAVERSDGLIHGRLTDGHGDYCAIGEYFETNPKTALANLLIDEVAAVNDSVPHLTMKQRKTYVRRWLRWKLAQLGMPGFRTQTPTQTPKGNAGKAK